jgi:hypothetical protein
MCMTSDNSDAHYIYTRQMEMFYTGLTRDVLAHFIAKSPLTHQRRR